jgi:DNA-binding transcriptional regulator YiaG
MKIRMLPDNKTFSGTATEIVSKMQKLNHERYESLNAYIEACRARFAAAGEELQIAGNKDEERSLSLLQAFVQRGLAKVEVASPNDVDQYSVALLRGLLGVSQERFAHELGVAYATVSRWERGVSRPSSMAITGTLGRLATRLAGEPQEQ